MDLGVMAMKEYSTFPKALRLEFHHQLQFSVISSTFVGKEVFALHRDLVRIFYSLTQLGYNLFEVNCIISV